MFATLSEDQATGVEFTDLLQLCRAPEQADAEFGSRGRHTDAWGIAACILHLATGQQPYLGLSMFQMVSAMLKSRPPDVPNSLPEWLQQVLKQCFSFDAAKRPSVSQLLKVGLCCPAVRSVCQDVMLPLALQPVCIMLVRTHELALAADNLCCMYTRPWSNLLPLKPIRNVPQKPTFGSGANPICGPTIMAQRRTGLVEVCYG